jgi:predicted RNA-binding protein
MQHARSYYLAVVRPDNLEKLSSFGLSFYAFSTRTRGKAIKKGDHIVLYRSRGTGNARVPGIVGIFEVTSGLLVAGDTLATGDAFLNVFPIQVPWRPIAIALSNPLPIAPLVPKLAMFTDKIRYGSTLQTTLKRMGEADYEIIADELQKHLSNLKSTEAVSGSPV